MGNCCGSKIDDSVNTPSSITSATITRSENTSAMVTINIDRGIPIDIDISQGAIDVATAKLKEKKIDYHLVLKAPHGVRYQFIDKDKWTYGTNINDWLK